MKIVKAGDILKIKTGKYDANHAKYDGKYKFFTCADIPSNADTFSFDDEVLILPGNGANVGKVYHFNGKLEAYQRTYILYDIKAFPKYLYHYFSKYWIRQSTKKQVGSATNYIKMDDIVSFQIPLPPLETQKHIAKILDDAAALRDKTVQLIKEYDALAQSIFLDMFGDPVKNEKGWEKEQLGNLCTKITDGTHKTPKYLDSGVFFLSAKNVKDFKLNCFAPKFISKEEHHMLSLRCNVEKKDIVITKSGSLGMAAMVNFDFEFSIFESLALVKYKRELINGLFLLYFLNTKSTQRQYNDITKGVGVKHLHLTDLRKLSIIMPAITLQNQFAEKISLIEQQKELAEKELAASEDLFNCLLQKAFKGELV